MIATLVTFAVLLGIAILILAAAVVVIARRHDQLASSEMPAEPDWGDESLSEAFDAGDPLTRQIAEIELTADAHIFDEIADAHAVRVDWRPPTFSQEWSLAGERLRELGDTQVLEAVR